VSVDYGVYGVPETSSSIGKVASGQARGRRDDDVSARRSTGSSPSGLPVSGALVRFAASLLLLARPCLR